MLQAVAPLRTGYVQDGDLFEIVPLYPEPRVAALSDEHPLARAGTVHITELTPYRLLQDSADVPE
ncbi:LysR substrate-binding domain-containing protein [Streptomyces sp900105755]|uniref:LysR substrate-binding domain-containing protein n=1 Tax=Streptomyces sp. 900105755 TaxID=3154389 RepID=A0ABV1TE08_9ACTN